MRDRSRLREVLGRGVDGRLDVHVDGRRRRLALQPGARRRQRVPVDLHGDGVQRRVGHRRAGAAGAHARAGHAVADAARHHRRGDDRGDGRGHAAADDGAGGVCPGPGVVGRGRKSDGAAGRGKVSGRLRLRQDPGQEGRRVCLSQLLFHLNALCLRSFRRRPVLTGRAKILAMPHQPRLRRLPQPRLGPLVQEPVRPRECQSEPADVPPSAGQQQRLDGGDDDDNVPGQAEAVVPGLL